MNSYSKLKLVKRSKKSNSLDFSELQPFPDEHTESTKPQLTIPKTLKPKQETNTQDFISSPPNLEHNDEPDNTHDNKLGTAEFIRKSSVSATTTGSSGRFELKKRSTNAFENAVKKTFSMRRSSSVSERYCRIHDQCVTLTSPFNDDDTDDDEKVGDDASKRMQTRSMEMMKKKKYKKYSSGSISKACKRLSNFLGFH